MSAFKHCHLSNSKMDMGSATRLLSIPISLLWILFMSFYPDLFKDGSNHTDFKGYGQKKLITHNS